MEKPKLYVDIDGVLLANEHNLAEGATEFIKLVADNFEVHWLTAHCMDSDPSWAVAYVDQASEEDLTPYLSKFRPTSWRGEKTGAINMDEPFIWYDDDCYSEEREALEEADAFGSWILVDLANNQFQLIDEIEKLKEYL